ncbi:MAG TPA: hypothetical protein VL426_04620 [Candidatus Binatia bacterium]|jgi:hypothetical protein|nr:hypothetical protein [Candidatus Binatia bacterium]
MFGSKAPPVISGGAAVVKGQRFHLERVLYAYVQVIDVLTGKFGKEGRSVLRSHRSDLKGPFLWPDPAKDEVLKLWRGLGSRFDALGEGFTHVFPGGMTAKAFMLGKVWCVYAPKTGLTTPQWKPVSEADTAPVIEIYGRDLPDGGRTGVGANTAEALERLFRRDLARYNLAFAMLSVETIPGRPQVACTVRFPRETYGAGEDWIRLRCVSPEGTELGPVGHPN